MSKLAGGRDPSASGGTDTNHGSPTGGGTLNAILTFGGSGPTNGQSASGGNSASRANSAGGGGTTSTGAASVIGGHAGQASGGAKTLSGSTSASGARTAGTGATRGGTAAAIGGAGGKTASNGGTSSGATGGISALQPALAFPRAQGFGKSATGARNGTVYHVTNLNDSGAGSFRDAVSASNRFVVFDVGGYVSLKTAVSVKSNITIAGQTAPGGGIGFRGGEISFANSSNIICRYIRVRPGSDTESDKDDALSLYRAKNVMIDHSSFEFGPWNNIDGVSDDWEQFPVTDITIQDSIIADPTGQQFGAHTESVSSQWAWYRNIFANSHNRNPLAKVNNVFVNNLLYNYSAGYTTHTSTSFKHDILKNYFVFGPASTGTDNTWFQVDKNQSIYSEGNLKDTNLNGALDGTVTTPYWYQGEGTVLTTPWSSETTATTPLEPASAARIAMSTAGALPRDQLDALIISQVLTLGKGETGAGANTAGPGGDLYTSQAATGLSNDGYGSIVEGKRPLDTDNDGMPDHWEHANGSDPSTNDAMTKAADGYTLLEQYANWLAEPHAATNVDQTIDVDLTAFAEGFATVSPSYVVSGAQNCTATLEANGHTVQVEPSTGFVGLASFTFAVTGTDRTTYPARVVVLVAP